MYVNNVATLLAMLNASVIAAGAFFGAKIGLFQNNMSPNRTNVLADFTVTTFNGITDWTAITWSAPFINDNQQAEVWGNLIHFLTTSLPSPAVTVYGYVIQDSGGTNVLLAERFATPYTFNRNGQALGLVPRRILDT